MAITQQNTRSLLLALTDHVTLLQELVVISMNRQNTMGKLVVRTVPGLGSKERQHLIDVISEWETRVERLDAHMASIKKNLAQIRS